MFVGVLEDHSESTFDDLRRLQRQYDLDWQAARDRHTIGVDEKYDSYKHSTTQSREDLEDSLAAVDAHLELDLLELQLLYREKRQEKREAFARAEDALNAGVRRITRANAGFAGFDESDPAVLPKGAKVKVWHAMDQTVRLAVLGDARYGGYWVTFTDAATLQPPYPCRVVDIMLV